MCVVLLGVFRSLGLIEMRGFGSGVRGRCRMLRVCCCFVLRMVRGV